MSSYQGRTIKLRGQSRVLRLFLLTIGVLALLLLVGWFAYQAGVASGRRTGRSEAFQLSRVNTSVDTYTVQAVVPPTTPQAGVAPSGPPTIQEICDTLPVGVPELLVRVAPGLNGTVTGSLQQGASVGVVCASDQLLGGVVWVQIAVEQPDAPAHLGWIPGQDIGYPPICLVGRVKPDELVLRSSDSYDAEPVQIIPGGTEVGIICNSAGGVWGESFWVRVRVVVDGMIVLGWAPAIDVLE
jgi:hypothetical protein